MTKKIKDMKIIVKKVKENLIGGLETVNTFIESENSLIYENIK